MIKKLSTLLAIVLTALTIYVPGTQASGKMEVLLNSKVTLQGDSRLQGVTYKWILKRGNEIISTQSNRIFSYTFTEPGTFTINVAASGNEGQVENTQVELLVGDRYPRPAVPVTDSDFVVVKLGQAGGLVLQDGTPVTLASDSTIVTTEGEVIEVESDGRLVTSDGRVLNFNSDGNLEDGEGNVFEIGTSSQMRLEDGRFLHVGPTGQILISSQPNIAFSSTGEVVTSEGEVLRVNPDGQVLQIQSADEKNYSDSLSSAARSVPLRLKLSTLPPMDSSGTVNLIGDSKVSFYLGDSDGEILEYRIDKNIFVDSDGNGNANDDIDNADHNSYLTGAPWETEYELGESPRVVAGITLVDKNGQRAQRQVEFAFGDGPSKEGAPVANLSVSPAINGTDGFVSLYGNEAQVSFYAKQSSGNILEYRIDKNIFVDSDQDGNPANDIDNLDHPSFKTGDLWTTAYEKTDEEIIAQLIVVGAEGRGSRVQVGLRFTDKPQPQYVTTGGPATIRLVADKEFVAKGDPITFTVTGLQQALDSYLFAWDFEGDGTVDKETEGINQVSHIYEMAGSVDATVTITDSDGNEGVRNLALIVKEAAQTAADFDFTVDESTVSFTDTSTVNTSLSDKRLNYAWSFGDPNEENFMSQQNQVGEPNPTYEYSAPGTYLVTLTVTDAEGVTDTRSAEIEITEMAGPSVPSEETPEEGEDETPAPAETVDEEGGNIFVTAIKIILYVILFSAVLLLLIFSGFLIFLKLQHPDLTFDELVDEVRIKLLGMMGVSDAEHEGSDDDEGSSDLPGPPKPEPAPEPQPKPEAEAKPEAKPEPKPEPEAEEPEIVESPKPTPRPEKPAEPAPQPTPKPQEPKPETPQNPNPTPPSPKAGPTPEEGDEKGPVPDWLKNR